MYSRGILEKGEKPHLQSAEPYKHRQLGRTVPQTEQSRRHSRAPRCSKMGTVQSHFSLIPLCQQGDKGKAPIFTEKPKSPSYTKHLNRHARLALLFTAVQTHLFLHLTHTRTACMDQVQSKAEVCSSGPVCTLISKSPFRYPTAKSGRNGAPEGKWTYCIPQSCERESYSLMVARFGWWRRCWRSPRGHEKLSEVFIGQLRPARKRGNRNCHPPIGFGSLTASEEAEGLPTRPVQWSRIPGPRGWSPKAALHQSLPAAIRGNQPWVP